MQPTLSLIGSVLERKPVDSSEFKSLPPTSASFAKTGFPPAQHRSKSAFARQREQVRQGDAIHRPSDPPLVVAAMSAESPNNDWREQISRDNEKVIENMTEEEREAERREILERFGHGIADVLRRAKEARQRKAEEQPEGDRQAQQGVSPNDILSSMVAVPVTTPTKERRVKRVGSPPPALSTSSTRPSSRADHNRKLRFAELTADDVHVYESAPPSPRRKKPLLLMAPDSSISDSSVPTISLGEWTNKKLKPMNGRTAQTVDSNAETQVTESTSPLTINQNQNNVDDQPEEGTPEYIRRRFFPHLPPNDPSLAWIEESSPRSSSSLRFDLSGNPIPDSRSDTLPTHLGLHHHAEGRKAGYTVDDIFLLTRSTISAQRAMMMGVLAGVIRWVGRITRDGSVDDKMTKVFVDLTELKGKEEDLRKRALAAGIHAMNEHGSLGLRAIEVIWECLVGWEPEPPGALVVLDTELQADAPTDEQSKYITSTISLEYFLPQVCDLLNVGVLPREPMHKLLAIIHYLARQTNAVADKIVSTPKLLAIIVQRFLLTPLPVTKDSPVNDLDTDPTPLPDPLALELLVILALASREAAVHIVEPADALLRFVAILPFSSLYPASLATELLTLTLNLYKVLASYGLYANIATTAAEQFACVGQFVASAQCSSMRLFSAYLELLGAWTVCATDPHRTTPEHEILWSQVVGWGWGGDILSMRERLSDLRDKESKVAKWIEKAWRSLWVAEAAWLEGARVNGVRAGEVERSEAIQVLQSAFEGGNESRVVKHVVEDMMNALSTLSIPDGTAPSKVHLQHLMSCSTDADTLESVLRLWLACTPPLHDGPLDVPPFWLPFSQLSELAAKVVSHPIWSWISLKPVGARHPYLISLYRPFSSFLSAYLKLSRKLPDVSSDLWLAQAFSILQRLLPGDEESAGWILDKLITTVTEQFMTARQWRVPAVIWANGGLQSLKPFLSHSLSSDKRLIGPKWITPQSILRVATQRLPCYSSLTSAKNYGLPVQRDWILSTLDHLLQSGTSPVFKELPGSWDYSEVDVVRSSFLLSKLARQVLMTYGLGAFVMTREETVFSCMKVFMLEHGQPHNDSTAEVFRDNVVGQLMNDMLAPFTLGNTSPSEDQEDLEQVAARFLGLSTPFYQYYTDFLALYDAISFSHSLFGRLLLPPTSLRYLIDYRRLLWDDYGHVLRTIRVPTDQIISGGLDEYLWPVETDAQMIGSYLRSLVKGDLTDSPFLRTVAIHHIASNIWPDLRQPGQDGGDERASRLVKAVTNQMDMDVIRDVVQYCPDFKSGVEIGDYGDWRLVRLTYIECLGDQRLFERLQGLLR